MIHAILEWVGGLPDKEHAGLIVLSQMGTAAFVIILNQVILKNDKIVAESLWDFVVRIFKRQPIKADETKG